MQTVLGGGESLGHQGKDTFCHHAWFLDGCSKCTFRRRGLITYDTLSMFSDTQNVSLISKIRNIKLFNTSFDLNHEHLQRQSHLRIHKSYFLFCISKKIENNKNTDIPVFLFIRNVQIRHISSTTIKNCRHYIRLCSSVPITYEIPLKTVHVLGSDKLKYIRHVSYHHGTSLWLLLNKYHRLTCVWNGF